MEPEPVGEGEQPGDGTLREGTTDRRLRVRPRRPQPRNGARVEDDRHRDGDGEPAMMSEPISRRRFLRGTATAAAGVAAGWGVPPARAGGRGPAAPGGKR